jgi:hypothetical protein
LALVLQVVGNFPAAARALRDRLHNRPAFVIDCEYDVQDLLFATLRSVFDDTKREEWTPQQAGSAKRIDILLTELGAVVEAKFVRDANHARRVADELRIDFECYHLHPACEHLIALVIDPDRLIADPLQFVTDLSGLRQKGASSFDVSVLVR